MNISFSPCEASAAVDTRALPDESLNVAAEKPELLPVPSERYFDILGVRFAAVQIPDVIRRIEMWIKCDRRAHYITVSNVHGVVESQHDMQVMEALNRSDLNVPDGMPIVWLGRCSGQRLHRRVYGPELFIDFCHKTQGEGYRHFFYGGAPEVVKMLVANLKERCPGIKIAGYYSPPFRALSAEEDEHIIKLINESQADVLWIGLGCPKQELWMYAHRQKISVPAAIGVGQAFNIYAGSVSQAPRWMREHGLEWLFRLLQEPKRLGRRYLVYNTEFLLRVTAGAMRSWLGK